MATTDERLKALEVKDERRDLHIKDIRENVKNIAEMQKEILIVLGGSELNKNKGVISMLDDVKSKVEGLQIKSESHAKDIDSAKWWGRGIAGALIITIFKIITDK
jgi:hypothetical protein